MRNEQISYVAFCEKCTTPRVVDKKIIQDYLGGVRVKGFYCLTTECGHLTPFPAYMRSILEELIESLDDINEQNEKGVPSIYVGKVKMRQRRLVKERELSANEE
ncbi:hypothetical protein AAXE64_27855 [Priestia megaterium]